MNKPFSSEQAKSLINHHNYVLNCLNNVALLDKIYVTTITAILSRLHNARVLDTLKRLPIDELSKFKKGLRLKPLRDANVFSLFDIHNLSAYDISLIDGISFNTASTLKSLTDLLFEKLKTTTKILVNTTAKDLETAPLVTIVFQYKNLLPLIFSSIQLLERNNSEIQQLIKNLRPSTSAFRWFFSFRSTKEKAILAYDRLFTLSNNEYCKQALDYFGKANEIKSMDYDTAWQSFSQNPDEFFSIIEKIRPNLLEKTSFYPVVRSLLEKECPEISKSKQEIFKQNLQKENGYYESLLIMDYNTLVSHLLEKHGAAQYDYFANETCRTKSKKVARTEEGLLCHHIDEDKAIMLSEKEHALKNPFSYQKADRLVYCDIIEHLILHIKIVENPRPRNANKDELVGIGGAINFICRQINDYYNGYEFKNYLSKACERIQNSYTSYIKVLNYFWLTIKSHPFFSFYLKKEELAKGWDGSVIPKILKEIKD